MSQFLLCLWLWLLAIRIAYNQHWLTPLHIAVSENQLAVVKYLVENEGADLDATDEVVLSLPVGERN